MTKRYNMFNYIETWIGIVIFVLFTAFVYIIIRYVYMNMDVSLIFRILLTVTCVLIYIFAFLPKLKKIFNIARNKAYNCDDGYISGRVRANESSRSYILSLDCVDALKHCAGKGCASCPYRISCYRTQYDWVFESSRLLLNKMEPSDSITHLKTVIDRYMNCDRTACVIDCSHADDCIELDRDKYLLELHQLFERKGITSASQITGR